MSSTDLSGTPTGQPDAGELVALPPGGPPEPVADPGLLPAVPDAPGAPVRAASPVPAHVIYADVTRAGERLPVIPPSRCSRANLRGTVAQFTALQWHRARYHGLRSPCTVLAVLVWALIGAVLLATRQMHWWWVSSSTSCAPRPSLTGDSSEWMRLHKEAKETRRIRGLVLLGEARPPWSSPRCCWPGSRRGRRWPPRPPRSRAAGPRLGRPAGHRIVGTGDRAAGLLPAHPRDHHPGAGQPGYPADQRRAQARQGRPGAGHPLRHRRDARRARLVLPAGPAARRQPRPTSSPSGNPWPPGCAARCRRPGPRACPQEHPGRLDLWIGMHDITKQKPPPCPLLKARQTDLFDVHPVRHRPAAAPGQGARCSRSTG